jgi:hypothetical protein
MVLCLDNQDLQELSTDSLQSFEKQIAFIPADLCIPFYVAAGRLESELSTLYRLVVLCTKKEEDLDKVAFWWSSMVRVCDEFITHLEGLVKQHPTCGAEYYRDRFLDVRNTCKRLQELHN